MRARYELLALVLIVAFLAGLAAVSHREDIDTEQLQQRENVLRSSYRTFPEGYRALYLTLGKLDIPVIRLIRPYQLLPARGLLIVADPYRNAISVDEARRLLKWLRAGNHALIITELHPKTLIELGGKDVPGDPVPLKIEGRLYLHDAEREDWWNNEPWWEKARWLKEDQAHPAPAIVPSFLATTAPALQIKSIFRFPATQPLPEPISGKVGGAVPLYRDERGVAIAYSAVGDGGIVWCCSPWSFSNQGLAAGTNLDFVLALARLQPGAPVILDEYHQGYGAGISVWTLAPTMTKLGILHGVAALVLLLVTLAWRFGLPRLPAEERFARSRAEYLTSMAGLLERARATHVVRDRLSTLLRRELGRRLGLSAHAPPERFLEANTRTQVVEAAGLERVMRHLATLEHQQRPAPEAVYRLAVDIQRLLHRKS
ncbi:MAG: DUF4350 domain-containing protein [Armatimonadota bacterium]